MVKNTRTQTGIGTSHQPLNMPTPIVVRMGPRHSPVAASVPKRGGARQARSRRDVQHNTAAELVNVAHVIDMWEIEDEWWARTPCGTQVLADHTRNGAGHDGLPRPANGQVVPAGLLERNHDDQATTQHDGTNADGQLRRT